MAARARASSPGTGTTRSGRSLALDMLDIEPPPDMPLDIEPPPVGPVPDSDPRRRHGGQVADVHEGATDIGGAQAERTAERHPVPERRDVGDRPDHAGSWGMGENVPED